MTDTRFDVLGIGNAIVDVLTHVDDGFLKDKGLNKGAMQLIDEPTANELYDSVGPAIEISGGSAANTIAGITSFGGTGAYIGKVRNDQLGNVFNHDIRSAGVDFTTSPAQDGPATARCLVLITPDGERTMNTFLGACVGLSPDDVDTAQVAAAKVTYLEGYLWDPPRAKEAFVKAAGAAKKAGRMVSLSLSDAFCVDRHRESFLELIRRDVDILFANESEIKSLYQVSGFDDALQAVRRDCEFAALTRSEHGSVVVEAQDVHVVEAHPIDRLADATGAGDLYAAGFLYGFTNGGSPANCARLGSLAAAEVISHVGARPEVSLNALAREKGLIA